MHNLQASGSRNSTKRSKEVPKNAANSSSSNSQKCHSETEFLKEVVRKIIKTAHITCRRKKKLVKIWHKPRPGKAENKNIQYPSMSWMIIAEPLSSAKLPELTSKVEHLLKAFDRRHRLYGNKEYADLLWQVCRRKKNPSKLSLKSFRNWRALIIWIVLLRESYCFMWQYSIWKINWLTLVFKLSRHGFGRSTAPILMEGTCVNFNLSFIVSVSGAVSS